MKKLGFGCMRLPVTDGRFDCVDKKLMCEMVDHFLAEGFTYFDTAWFYHDGQSEAAIKECLVDRYPRSAFLLADKMPLVLVQEERELEEYFTTQLNRCGVDYFDYYLIHDMGGDRYGPGEQVHIFDFLSQKKAAGSIKRMGFSFHDSADVLDRILTDHPEVDFVQLQLNYLDWDSEAIQSRKCYETAVKHGKPVIVMEPVKGGTLADVPEQVKAMFRSYAPQMSVASWAIRFAASLDHVTLVLSGMSNMEQLTDNTAYMKNFVPLNDEEQAVIAKAVDLINANIAIPCTGCAYCINDCPLNIAIPKYFSIYNTEMQEIKGKAWTPQQILYDHLAAQAGKAGDCIGCGQCEKMCPQHLHIRELLHRVSEHFEQ